MTIGPAQAYRAAFELWVVYYADTETYDRTLPGHFYPRVPDEWLPRGDYIGTSNRFALKAAMYTKRAIGLLEVDQETSERSRLKAQRLPYAELRRLAALVGD